MSFSIVIPTLNEERFLPLLLSDLETQTYKNFEVIIVDGNSDDRTRIIARSWAKKKSKHRSLDIRVVLTKKRNVSFQRNVGIKKAQNKYIIFFDADTRIDKNFLKKIRQNLKNKTNKCVFTCWTETESLRPSDILLMNTINATLELYKALNKPSALGAFMGCERSLAKKTLFDEKQKIFEEAFFVQKAIKNSGKYYIFRNMRYNFSLRRVKTEGILKMLIINLKTNYNYLSGNSFEATDYGYSMQGGGKYIAKNNKSEHAEGEYVHSDHRADVKEENTNAKDKYINTAEQYLKDNLPFFFKINESLAQATKTQLKKAKQKMQSLSDLSPNLYKPSSVKESVKEIIIEVKKKVKKISGN